MPRGRGRAKEVLMSVLAASDVLAENVNNFGDTRGGALAGPLGLLIIALLSIGTVLLIRNMNKRLRRLPQSFPGQDDAAGPDGAAGPGGTPVADGTAARSVEEPPSVDPASGANQHREN
jgi:hypothetical protein